MRWAHETWLKIYKNPGAKWLSLPVSTRGLGRELLLYADHEGRIFTGPGKRGHALARMLGAHASELKRVAEDVQRLIDDGYLVEDGDAVVIRNYVEAQERVTNSAQRTRRWREKNAEKASHVTSHEPSHVTHAQSHVTDKSDGVVSCRVDPCRVDPPLAPPPGGGAPSGPPGDPGGAAAPPNRRPSSDCLREAREALLARGRLL